MERTSYDKREHAPDYAGTTQWLWGITAAVYLSLLGPQGMRELGEGILQRSPLRDAAARRDPRREGAAASGAAHFKEFVVNFDGTGKTRGGDQRARCANAASSAVTISAGSSRSSGRARSTA